MNEDPRVAAARRRAERAARAHGEEPEEVASSTAASRGMTELERAAVVETAIQQAIRRGDFDDLPGAGKPIPGLGEHHDPDWWIRRKIEREQLRGLGPAGAHAAGRERGARRPPRRPVARGRRAARRSRTSTGASSRRAGSCWAVRRSSRRHGMSRPRSSRGGSVAQSARRPSPSSRTPSVRPRSSSGAGRGDVDAREASTRAGRAASGSRAPRLRHASPARRGPDRP